MSAQDLEQARLAEYRQRSKVELIRHQVYAQPNPTQTPQLLAKLARAEQELRRLEGERRQKEPAERGMLLNTAAESGKLGGSLMGRDTTGIDAQVKLRLSHVPTGIVHLLDSQQTPLVTFSLRYVGSKFTRLRVSSYVEGYSAHAVNSIELFPDNSIDINQLPTFFPDRLQQITELTRATLQIQIDDLDGKVEQQSAFPIWLLARTSAYNGVEDPSTGGWVDLSAYFGAWVTPNAPAVLALLRRASDLHPEKIIAGYQGQPEAVEPQVRAIFDALKVEGLTYINSVLSFGATKGQYMQRIRLPKESLKDRSANCIDGTVLVASLLEAASMNPGLVLVPGHAFVAWETWEGNGQWDYLETTMIGSHDFETARSTGRDLAKYYQELHTKSKDPADWQLLPLNVLRTQYAITPME